MGVLTDAERKKKRDEENLKLRQRMSLIRQGDLSVEGAAMISDNKVWTEDSIRNLAFGEDVIFQRMPKNAFEHRPVAGFQIDMPIMPAMFTVKCFNVPSSISLSEPQYKELLIKFYSRLGQVEEKVWSLREIDEIVSFTKTDVFDGIFQNYAFKIRRSDKHEYTITLADLPILNPSDLINMLKMFTLYEKVNVSSLINHFRAMLKFYYHALAENDYVLAKEVGMTVEKPFVLRDGISKYPDGKILQKPRWGIVFKNQKHGRILNGFLDLDERERFSNEVIISVLKRIALCEVNTKDEIREVEQILNWTLAVRKVMVDAKPIIFQRR